MTAFMTSLGDTAAACRYKGMFKDGQRQGYGMLHYATGAVYEGEWEAEQKHGQGVFLFEDGTVFKGHFEQDRPVLADGAVFAPRAATGVQLRVQDLLSEVLDTEASLPAQVQCGRGSRVQLALEQEGEWPAWTMSGP